MDAPKDFLAPTLAPICVFGALLHLLVVVTNAPYVHKLPPPSFLLFWKSFTGLIMDISNSVFAVTVAASDTSESFAPAKSKSSLACQIHGAIMFAGFLVALGILAGVSGFRYLMILKEVKIKNGTSTVVAAFIFAFSAFIVCAPFLLGIVGVAYSTHSSRVYCLVAWADSPYFSIVFIGLVCLGFPVVAYPYIKIYLYVRDSIRSFQQSEGSDGRQYPKVTRENAPTKLRRDLTIDEKKVLIQSLMIVASYVVGAAPGLIVIMYEALTGTEVSMAWDFLAIICFQVAEAINQSLVIFFDRNIRENMLRMARIGIRRNAPSVDDEHVPKRGNFRQDLGVFVDLITPAKMLPALARRRARPLLLLPLVFAAAAITWLSLPLRPVRWPPPPPSPQLQSISSLHALPLVAYAFLVHSESTVASLEDSMALLYSEDDLFLIHADLSTSNSARIHLHRAYDNKPNVFVVDKLNSSRSKWGSIDLLRAEVTLVRTALLLKHPWSVLVMLDGSTFPLQSASVIKRALEPIARQNSTVLFGAFRDKPKMLDQCDSNYASSSICWEHAWRKALRRGKTTPNNYPVYKGSQWIVLSRQAAEYAVTESVAEPWLDFFGSAFAPDEFFFQSVLANAGWSRVDGFRLVFKIHSDQGCRSFKPSRSPGFGPCTLGENDWDEISRAQKDGFLFARKFLAKDSVKKLIVENYSDDR